MSKLSALLAYQDADLHLQQIENAIRKTENRQQLNRLHKTLKDQQAAVARQSDQLAQMEGGLDRLQAQMATAEKRLAVENAEFETLRDDQ
jgi:septal ring factor EnvC (AmiA/AmiB activator)